MKKYHIKPNGDPGICVAKKDGGCKYKLSSEEHYSTIEEARVAYEEAQNSQILFSLHNDRRDYSREANVEKTLSLPEDFSLDKYYEEDFEYVFEKQSDDYGIVFASPEHDTAYIETNDDGSVFYRFEQLDELFDEFDVEDVREGYSTNVPLHTVQKFVSEDLVNYYAHTGETDSITVYDDEDEGHPPSLMRVLVHKGNAYVIDGNHRFAAARVAGSKSFSGIVIGMDDEMENMWVVPPEYFNKMF